MQNLFKILTTGLLLLAYSSISAQSLSEARALYNEGITAAQEENLAVAIEKFTECYDICETLYEEEEDEEAEELMSTVGQNIPTLVYKLSKEQLQAKQIKGGLATAYKAKEAAANYGDDDVLKKTKKLIPQIHYKIGASYYKKDMLDEAIVELDKGLQVDANYADIYYIKAVIYKKKADDALVYETAKKGIEAAKATNNFKTEGKITKIGSSYFLKKGNDAKASSEYDAAIGFLNKSLEFDAKNTTVHYLLTSIYNSKKDWNNAITSANEGLQYEEEASKARFYFELGTALYGKGDNAGACEAFSKAAVGDYLEHANYQMEHVVKCSE